MSFFTELDKNLIFRAVVVIIVTDKIMRILLAGTLSRFHALFRCRICRKKQTSSAVRTTSPARAGCLPDRAGKIDGKAGATKSRNVGSAHDLPRREMFSWQRLRKTPSGTWRNRCGGKRKTENDCGKPNGEFREMKPYRDGLILTRGKVRTPRSRTLERRATPN